MRLPTTPLSDCYGYDRGTPVDRRHIERFLARHATHVRGDGLEVKDDTYLRRYDTGLTSTTVLDIEPDNPQATLIGDLIEPGCLPADAFDIILLTQTLQLVAHPAAAIDACRRALRPGGTVLITVPALGRVSPHGGDHDRWRFTRAGLAHLLAGWPGPTTITSHGNVRVCLAALLGEAVEELDADDYAPDDPAFPLTICAAAHMT